MAEDGDGRGANEPQDGRDGRGPQTQGNGDDEQGRVELARSSPSETNVQVGALQLANAVHAAGDENDDEEQDGVCEERVDGQHDEEDGIVGAEVAQVVVHARLDLAKVLRFANALDVEEFADGLEVGEARGQRGVANALEARAQIQARRQGVDGNAEA